MLPRSVRFPLIRWWRLACKLGVVAVLAVTCFAGLNGPERAAAQIGGLNLTFTASPTNAQVGQPVTFSYSATPPAVAPPFASIQALFISFGDGDTTTGNTTAGPGQVASGTVAHTYTGPGTYTAMLNGLATNGASNTVVATVVVAGGGNPLPGGLNLTFTAAPTNVQVGQPVTFSYSATPPAVAPPFASIQALFIDFGDGDSTTGNTTSGPGQPTSGTVTHIYTTANTYTATLRGLATNGASNTAVASVVVSGGGNPPTVSLTATPTVAQVGQPVSFNYSASAAPGITFPTIRSMLINYNDGAPLPLTPPAGVTSHTFNTPGTYSVLLTATDSNGQFGQITAPVQVISSTSGQPPSNVLIVNPQSAAPAGQAVTFNAATASTPNTGASIQSYNWNFGDGGTSTGQSVSHAFTSPGTYTVTLTVTDTTGASAQNSTQITISSSAPGVSVTLQQGWNLIAAPNGTTIPGPLGPLYTFQAGNTAYQSVQNPQTGLGYWAFFSAPTTVTIPVATSQTFTRSLPAGQYVMLGNPGSTTATVSGADVVYAYNAATGYQQTTTLQPGQGAWVLSNNGGTVTITGAAR